jgi:hypothetical protein
MVWIMILKEAMSKKIMEHEGQLLVVDTNYIAQEADSKQQWADRETLR